MIFRYYIIGNDGRPYEQSVNATTQAEAQRLANRFAQEDGTTLLTVPDTTTGTTRLVPEYYDNLNERTGISNVAGRSISLPALEAGGIAPILSPDDPALNPRNPITGVPAGVNVSNPNELTGQTFYGDVNTGYGVATPGMAGSRGTTSAGNVPFNIDAALAMGGFTQGMVPTGPANTFDPSNPLASGSGTAPDPFAYNPEFTTNLGMSSSGLTSSPASAFGGTDIDFMEESSGAMAGFGESAAQKEARLKAEKAEAEKAGAGDIGGDEVDPDSLPIDINSLSDLQKEELRLLANVLTADPKNLKQFIDDRGENYARKVLSANGFSSIQIDNLIEGTTLE